MNRELTVHTLNTQILGYHAGWNTWCIHAVEYGTLFSEKMQVLGSMNAGGGGNPCQRTYVYASVNMTTQNK